MLVLFSGCSKDIFLNFQKHARGENPFDPMEPEVPASEEAGPWLFMVYLDAANNLESAGLQDLHEMEQGISGAEEITIIVLMDRMPGFSTADGDWTDTRLFLIDKNNTKAKRIAGIINGANITSTGTSGEVDMGNKWSLLNFIEYCITNYATPDTKLLLDIWNHGGGYRDSSTEENLKDIRKPICWDDEQSHNTLYMNEVQEAINGALLSTSRDKIDIVYMDACLMQMVEVAYELQNDVRYLVASEETVPGNGGDYVNILERYKSIYAEGNHNPYRFSYEIVSSYREQYNTTGDTTLSSLDLSKLSPLLEALSTFGNALKNESSSKLKDIRSQTKHFAYPDQADLYDFVQLCQKNISGGVSGADELMKTIDDIMVKEYHHASLDAHGIAIYFPVDPSQVSSFYYNNDGYLDTLDGNSVNLAFDNSGNGWVGFIQWWETQ